MADPTVARVGWMLAALALTLAPAVSRLPPWITAVFVACAVWRFTASRRRWRLPPQWLRLLLAATSALGVLLTYRTFNGLEAGGALLVATGAMKLLETRTPRDIQVLALIGYFIILTQLLHDQPIWTLPWLVISVGVINFALMQGVRAGAPLPPTLAMGVVARMLAFAAPVALVLFILFPRVPGPFWSLPSRGAQGVTGLSDQMSPGLISQLVASDDVAFRVSFNGSLPPPSDRYWRGPVLEQFDGWTWSESARVPNSTPGFRPAGPGYSYRIVLQPHGRNWLLALDFPGNWSANDAFLTREFQLVSRRPVDGFRALDIQSWPDAWIEPDLAPITRAHTLKLPDSRNPRAQALARSLRSIASSDQELVNALLNHFSEGQFVYTLQPPVLSATHSVDDFLFRTRRGFCEHYASAFTFMARAAGLPARVVTGYQGGQVNPVSGRLVVRQSDAHAWSEVWLAGRGWVRVDPTGAIAPQRIAQGLMEALPSGERLPGRALRQLQGLRALTEGWDALNSLWADWVLGYGPERQMALLERLGFPEADWRSLVATLVVLVAIIMGILTLWLASRSRAPAEPPVERLYRNFCRHMAKVGTERHPQEGPRDFAARAAELHPEQADAIRRITRIYLALRYEPRGQNDALLALLRLELSRFRPRKTQTDGLRNRHRVTPRGGPESA